MEVTFMDPLPPLPNFQRRDSAIDLAKALAICAVLPALSLAAYLALRKIPLAERRLI